MMKTQKQTTLALSLCTTLVAATGIAQAGVSVDQSPFAMRDLGKGYLVAENHEGKCGEGKCGGSKTVEGKCGEGKCGSKQKNEAEGKSGGEQKSHAEGKCGEGKCGGKQ
jgi:uncharacterized low-complexity protein